MRAFGGNKMEILTPKMEEIYNTMVMDEEDTEDTETPDEDTDTEEPSDDDLGEDTDDDSGDDSE